MRRIREEAYSAFTIIDRIGMDGGVQKGSLKNGRVTYAVVTESAWTYHNARIWAVTRNLVFQGLKLRKKKLDTRSSVLPRPTNLI